MDVYTGCAIAMPFFITVMLGSENDHKLNTLILLASSIEPKSSLTWWY
jgi:hypothetical protein